MLGTGHLDPSASRHTHWLRSILVGRFGRHQLSDKNSSRRRATSSRNTASGHPPVQRCLPSSRCTRSTATTCYGISVDHRTGVTSCSKSICALGSGSEQVRAQKLPSPNSPRIGALQEEEDHRTGPAVLTDFRGSQWAGQPRPPQRSGSSAARGVLRRRQCARRRGARCAPENTTESGLACACYCFLASTVQLTRV